MSLATPVPHPTITNYRNSSEKTNEGHLTIAMPIPYLTITDHKNSSKKKVGSHDIYDANSTSDDHRNSSDHESRGPFAHWLVL